MLRPRYNLWIENDGQVVVSRWRADLLRAIDREGSITAAAESMQVPYRRAWERVQEMENCLGKNLVETEVGGSSGGGARLSPAGWELLNQFAAFSAGFDEQVERRFKESFGTTRTAG